MKTLAVKHEALVTPITLAICFGSVVMFKYIMVTASYVKLAIGN